MEIKELKKFVEKNIVDFTELLLTNYNKLELDEVDAIILIKLHHLIKQGVSFISPKVLSESLSISASTTARRLNHLIDREFIKMELVKGENGKQKENYNLDKVFEKILLIDFEERKGDKGKQSTEKELVDLFETEFKKPLSVLDIQTITKWLNDDKYSFEEIKDALFVAVKQRKLTIKYVDGILLKSEKEEPKTYKKTNLMRDLHQLWEK
jgi:DNA replication protein